MLPNVCFVCTGDDCQLDAIGNLHGSTRIDADALGQSDMLKVMCPTHIELVENKRSDPVIHAFVTKCRKRPIEEVLDEGRALFTYEGEADNHLVISNWKRRRINIDRNQALKPEGSRLLKARDTPIYLYEGLKLQGRCTKKRYHLYGGKAQQEDDDHQG